MLALRHEHSGLTVQLGEANTRLQQILDSRNGLKEATYINATRLDELRMLDEVEQALRTTLGRTRDELDFSLGDKQRLADANRQLAMENDRLNGIHQENQGKHITTTECSYIIMPKLVDNDHTVNEFDALSRKLHQLSAFL